MNRKQFIKSSLLLTSMGAVASCNTGKPPIKGSIVGASAATGHLLRKANFSEPSETIFKKVVIVGGGVSGLSAARYLHQNGEDDFLLFDLEKEVGGNAASGKNDVSAYPWGAHYVPIPNNNLEQYLGFLKDCGVITGFENGLPVYNEYHLCFDPEERLYINGRWQEGLIPQFGVPADQLSQIESFLQTMNEFRYAKGKDGKDAFAIPVNESSTDMDFAKLDNLTMKEWMIGRGYTGNYLHQYVNYCTRDDFGTPHDVCSAWAGIHYFASRKGRAANAEHGDVLTWPQGNGFLIEQLKKDIGEKLQTNALVTAVKFANERVIVHFFDVKTGITKAVDAKQCIVAVPQFVAARLLNDAGRTNLVHQHLQYAPWMVANMRLLLPAERLGVAACWDNVIFESQSLGYVEATHQLTTQYLPEKNITYYLPLTQSSPVEERKKALERTHSDWVEIIMQDLQKIHPDIREVTKSADILLWGHAMVQPTKGFIYSHARRQLAASVNSAIHFSHTDIAGVSIFEEGFYQGIHAAEKVLKHLKTLA
ncbi:MAG: FAD-dependent oxidoreductase [Agriterribacter sp.]